jgi:Xaa-Pro aminopeptidase
MNFFYVANIFLFNLALFFFGGYNYWEIITIFTPNRNKVIMGRNFDEQREERLSALRRCMAEFGIDAYIVPSSDAHLSEYVPERWKSRRWISGFTGSAGTVVVTARKAGLWTDSRYFLQAAAELEGSEIDLYKVGIRGTPSIADFLRCELSGEAVVGLDGMSYSVADGRALRNLLGEKNIALRTDLDLIGTIWAERPGLPADALFELPVEITGLSVHEKLNIINDKLHEAGADGVLLCALDEVAWTFNIRGNDVAYNPVVTAYGYVSENESALFVVPSKLTPEIARRLEAEGVTLANYNMVGAYLSQLREGTTVALDPNKTNCFVYDSIPSHIKIREGLTPVNLLKSVKNETEISGFRKAMVRDGVALTRFYIWLEKQLAAGEQVTEISLAGKLSALRAEQPLYISGSFETICAFGGHGAIVHYCAGPETDAVVRPEGLLLMDSGAQYLDGTTDVTRTIALGEPTEGMRRDFTRVLKGHISLAKSKFPLGTRGSQLDILARKALWEVGINYLHGTGHGVGHCLNVHEGPQSIRMEENPVGLQPGMVVSNEPGVYRTNEYGIRTENIMVAREEGETEFGSFLSFETLTLCYIDTRLVALPMLSAREHLWLNKYHQQVWELLSPHLTEEEQAWLKEKTKEI